ncbi:MAG: MATE family efflux transporter [Pirellulales bacterium]
MKSDLHISARTHDRAGSLGELLRVSVPLIISYSATALMHVVDRIFLSWYSVDAMAATLPAGVIHWNLASLAIGTVTYANAIVGQYVGAGDEKRVGPVLWQGIYMSLVAAGLMLCLIPLASATFAAFDHHADIQHLEVRYFTILAIGTGPLLVSSTLSCFYSGRGRTATVMVANIIATLFNVVLDYVLIFGKAGFPELGIEGAAIATSISFASIALMYVIHMLWTERHSHYCLWSGWRFDRELFARLFKYGFPSGVQQFLDIACWSIFIQLMGRLGKAELAATGLVFNLNSLAFIPMMGLGTAVTALVGQRIGDARPQLAVRTTWLAFGVAMVYTLAFATVYLFVPHVILAPYGVAASQPEVASLVIQLLRLVALYSIFDATAVVFSSAIRGAGDTRFAMYLSVTLGAFLLVLPTVYAVRHGSAGFLTSWYAVVAFLFALAVGFVLRFQQGRWKTMRVIEHTAADIELEPEAAVI